MSNSWKSILAEFEEGGHRSGEAAAHFIIEDIRAREDRPWGTEPKRPWQPMLAVYFDALDLAERLCGLGEETWAKALDLAVALKYRSIVTSVTKPEVPFLRRDCIPG